MLLRIHTTIPACERALAETWRGRVSDLSWFLVPVARRRSGGGRGASATAAAKLNISFSVRSLLNADVIEGTFKTVQKLKAY